MAAPTATSAPKRFPDRDEIAAVRREAELLEPGQEGAEQRRLAGRVLARRGGAPAAKAATGGADPDRRSAPAAVAHPLAAARHLPRAHGCRAALPPPLPRPARQRGDARRLRPPLARPLRHAALPRGRGFPRGRDARAPVAVRRRLRAPVRDAPQRARRGPVPARGRRRAVPEEPD